MDPELKEILETAGAGKTFPSEDLLPLVYDELRNVAAARLNGGAGQTLQPTALVHEAWLRLSGDSNRRWNDRAHFFRAAALAMRNILVDKARSKASLKHHPGKERVDFENLEIEDTTQDERVLWINEMLDILDHEDTESARIITLKFFGGLTNREIARTDGVTERTIEKKWAFAKARLYQLIQEHSR